MDRGNRAVGLPLVALLHPPECKDLLSVGPDIDDAWQKLLKAESACLVGSSRREVEIFQGRHGACICFRGRIARIDKEGGDLRGEQQRFFTATGEAYGTQKVSARIPMIG